MENPGWYCELKSARVYELARSWRHWLHGPRGVEMLVDQAMTIGYKDGFTKSKDASHVQASHAD